MQSVQCTDHIECRQFYVQASPPQTLLIFRKYIRGSRIVDSRDSGIVYSWDGRIIYSRDGGIIYGQDGGIRGKLLVK